MAISLRRRLLTILLSLILLIWLFAVVFTVLHSRSVVLKQIDERLIRYADMGQHTIEAVLGDPQVRDYFQNRATHSESNPFARMTGFNEGQEQVINLWFGESNIQLSENSQRLPKPESTGLVTKIVARDDDNSEWRIIYRHLPAFNVWLAVGVDLEHARRNGAATFWQIVLPLLIAMPLTAGFLIVGVERGLAPLQVLAENIAARNPHAMTPLNIDNIPRELYPVVNSLNGLLERLERALASESRFTANAAHELQTPLSAIKAEVQRCLRLETDSATRSMLRGIETRVRRSADTVQQLLTLARLDPDQEFKRSHFDVSELLLDVIADMGGIAHDRNLELDMDFAPAISLTGNAEWMRVLLRNLIANAFKYADAGSVVGIAIKQSESDVELVIENACSPLPSDVYQRLSERFFRPAGQRANGVGLGLSIVQRIAELHDAAVQLGAIDESGGGFKVVVNWPLS
jgi:two-component system sensor histidine kinase QseC